MGIMIQALESPALNLLQQTTEVSNMYVSKYRDVIYMITANSIVDMLRFTCSTDHIVVAMISIRKTLTKDPTSKPNTVV